MIQTTNICLHLPGGVVLSFDVVYGVLGEVLPLGKAKSTGAFSAVSSGSRVTAAPSQAKETTWIRGTNTQELVRWGAMETGVGMARTTTRHLLQELKGASRRGRGAALRERPGVHPSTGWVCPEAVKFLLSSAGRGIGTPVSKAFHTPPRTRHEGGQS